MNSIQAFNKIWDVVKGTSNWRTMEATVEGSEWHREANVAVHTTMCIEHYIANTASQRSEREQILTLVTLLFHDFGKPEAEEHVTKDDGSVYRRYAGHEPVSANEFISFVCDHPEVVKMFADVGIGWGEIMKIKFMIENHLPYGLKNEQKVKNFRATVIGVLGADEQCFYDQLWSDCNGRISDDHETKRQKVVDWVQWFKAIEPAVVKKCVSDKVMYVLCGVVGVGKSTWTKQFKSLNKGAEIIVISEDTYREDLYRASMTAVEAEAYKALSRKEQYAVAWQWCADSGTVYEQYVKAQLAAAVSSGATLVLDRTNQTRKSRSKWITAAKQKGYKVVAVQFYCSERVMHERQKSRADKDVPYRRAHEIFMKMETPWYPIEVDDVEIVPPF